MKKSILILLSLLIVGGAFAQKAPTTKLISSSEERIVVQVDLNGFNTIKAQTPQGEQFIISVPKMAANLEAGTPDLPTFPVPTIIGDRAEMTVNVINAQYTDYTNMEIAPSKGNISRQNNPNDIPYTYGDVYDADGNYVDTVFENSGTYYLHKEDIQWPEGVDDPFADSFMQEYLNPT